MRAASLRSLRGAVVLCAISIGTVGAQQSAVSWKDYLGGPDSSHYSPLKQITPANVSKLETAWSYPAGDGNYSFSPLVIDNVAYVAAKQGALVALDASTGKELWVHAFGAAVVAGAAESAASAAPITGRVRTAPIDGFLSPREGSCTRSTRAPEIPSMPSPIMASSI